MKITVWSVTHDNVDYSPRETCTHVRATKQECIDLARKAISEHADLSDQDWLIRMDDLGVTIDIHEHSIEVPLEMLHGRDPDSSCVISMWVNGEPVSGWVEEDVDPGAGYVRAEWDEDTRQMGESGYTPAFLEAVVRERNSAAEHSPYIEGEPDEPPLGDPKFKPGQELFYTPTTKGDRPGLVMVVRVLDGTERDDEVGHMYEVVYVGTTADTEHAFEDELVTRHEHEERVFEASRDRVDARLCITAGAHMITTRHNSAECPVNKEED